MIANLTYSDSVCLEKGKKKTLSNFAPPSVYRSCRERFDVFDIVINEENAESFHAVTEKMFPTWFLRPLSFIQLPSMTSSSTGSMHKILERQDYHKKANAA